MSGYPRDTAEFAASMLCKRLADYCERIEIAGSIRRKRPRVNDIDLVVIPKMESRGGTLFEATKIEDTKFYDQLEHRVVVSSQGQKIISGHLCIPGHDSIPVDVFIATPETWATLLLIRTGSKEHNIEMCQQAASLGLSLKANGEGILRRATGEVSEEIIPCETEEQIFEHLKMTWKPAEAR